MELEWLDRGLQGGGRSREKEERGRGDSSLLEYFPRPACHHGPTRFLPSFCPLSLSVCTSVQLFRCSHGESSRTILQGHVSLSLPQAHSLLVSSPPSPSPSPRLEYSSTTASPSRSSRSSRSPLSSTASSSSAQRSSRCARSRSRSTRRTPVADTHPTTTHEQKTASGLYLPSAASQAPPPEGTVLAVGPGAPRKDGSIAPVSLKEGDRVVLPAFGGVPVKVGEEVSGAQGPQSLVRREPRGRPFGRSLRPASAWYSLSERAALTGLCHIRTGVPPLPRLGDPRQAQRVN